MNEPNFTPGPWAYRPERFDDWGFVRGPADADGHRWPVARALAGRFVTEDEQHRHRADNTDPFGANAHLIAAAPDLYEAANALVARLDEDSPPQGERPTIEQLEAILAAKPGTIEVKPDGSIHVAPREEIEALRAALARARGETS